MLAAWQSSSETCSGLLALQVAVPGLDLTSLILWSSLPGFHHLQSIAELTAAMHWLVDAASFTASVERQMPHLSCWMVKWQVIVTEHQSSILKNQGACL